jgi:cell division protein FtsW (lipid II flippase)
MDASIYRLKYRDILTLCVIALLCLGVLMVQSASMRVSGKVGWQWTAVGSQHLKLAVAALCTYFIVSKIDYAWLANSGVVPDGARAWLREGD